MAHVDHECELAHAGEFVPHRIISVGNEPTSERYKLWRESVPVKTMMQVKTLAWTWWRTSTVSLVVWFMLSSGQTAGNCTGSMPKNVVAHWSKLAL